MNSPDIYRCNNLIKTREGNKRVMIRCRRPGAEPQFTARIYDATDLHPQPMWLCQSCRGLYPRIHAITGDVIRPATRGKRKPEVTDGEGRGRGNAA